MTPMQGMELINPDLLKRQIKDASGKDSYFSTKSGFSTVIQLKNSQNSGAGPKMGPPANQARPQHGAGLSSNMIL
jgi:hypothetical protein